MVLSVCNGLTGNFKLRYDFGLNIPPLRNVQRRKYLIIFEYCCTEYLHVLVVFHNIYHLLSFNSLDMVAHNIFGRCNLNFLSIIEFIFSFQKPLNRKFNILKQHVFLGVLVSRKDYLFFAIRLYLFYRNNCTK